MGWGHMDLASQYISVVGKCIHTDNLDQSNTLDHILSKENMMKMTNGVITLTCDCIWFWHKSWQTSTDGITVSVGGAGSAWTTGAGVTGIWPLHTFLIPTDVSVLAVWVYHTFWSTT